MPAENLLAIPCNENRPSGAAAPAGAGRAPSYEESVRALLSLGRELASPRHARTYKFGLGNMEALVERLGNPQRACPAAHIAGTNGKGSTAAMLEAILSRTGLRTGLYTSPHLERINERIRIQGRPISDEAFAAAWTRVEGAAESLLASGILASHPTFFECVTAMAFQAFASAGTEFAVYEVGLGGRLDATNVVQPEVAVLTTIDFDHESFLGHSIEEIAGEKAGIIKAGCPVASSNERPEVRRVIARRCAEMGARLVELEGAWNVEGVALAEGCYRATAKSEEFAITLKIAPRLRGAFQIRNALAAATGALLLADGGYSISREAIEDGIASAEWAGRLEQISVRPAIYLDGAHNPGGAKELAKFWEENFAGRRIILVYGAMRDKAVDEIAEQLFPRAGTVIFTQAGQMRALSASLLREMAGELASEAEIIADPAEALERAIAICGPEDVIFGTGSLYLVGDLKSYWKRRRRAQD